MNRKKITIIVYSVLAATHTPVTQATMTSETTNSSWHRVKNVAAIAGIAALGLYAMKKRKPTTLSSKEMLMLLTAPHSPSEKRALFVTLEAQFERDPASKEKFKKYFMQLKSKNNTSVNEKRALEVLKASPQLFS